MVTYLFFLKKFYFNLCRQFGDDSGMAKACGNIGNTLQLLGEYDEAIKYSLRNLEMSQKANDLVKIYFFF